MAPSRSCCEGETVKMRVRYAETLRTCERKALGFMQLSHIFLFIFLYAIWYVQKSANDIISCLFYWSHLLHSGWAYPARYQGRHTSLRVPECAEDWWPDTYFLHQEMPDMPDEQLLRRRCEDVQVPMSTWSTSII